MLGMIAIFHIVRIIIHQITSQWGLHAQWSMKMARQKRSEICAVRVAKSKKNDLFFGNIFFLIRRPRNTERVVIFFSMLMRLHARFRTRRDIYVHMHTYLWIKVSILSRGFQETNLEYPMIIQPLLSTRARHAWCILWYFNQHEKVFARN